MVWHNLKLVNFALYMVINHMVINLLGEISILTNPLFDHIVTPYLLCMQNIKMIGDSKLSHL